jgi:heat shock protein HslJ
LLNGCAQRDILSKKSLGNLTYENEIANFGKAALENGTFMESVMPGSASKNLVKIKGDPVYGVIDNRRAAAVIIVTNTSGSGVFFDLAVITETIEADEVVSTINIGDRIVVDSIFFNNDTIFVDIETQAEGEPMVDHSKKETRKFLLDDKHDLREIKKNNINQILDVKWKLFRVVYKNDAEKTIEHPERYLLQLSEKKKISILADCNRGFGSYSMEERSIKIVILGTTRAMCPPKSFSEKYISDLNSVVSYRLKGSRLYLSLKDDIGIMEFGK